MNRLKIALLAGGDSSERAISLQSAAQIAAAMDNVKYDIRTIDVCGSEWTYDDGTGNKLSVDKNDFSLGTGDEKIVFDYALILIHGTPGEDGKLQGYLDIMGVSYSSCGVGACAVTFDKRVCKNIASEAGLNVAKEVFISGADHVDPELMVEKLGLPMFIKPNASGSSFGVSRVERAEDIRSAVETAFTESDTVLAEELLDGREVSCGILITEDKEYIFPVTEIVSKKDFFDYEAKYTPGCSEELTPADLPADTVAELNRMTRDAYKACGCRGIVRIDFMVRPDAKPYMIEINTVPGMSAGSIVPKQAACMGLSLGELFELVIEDTYKPRV